jgi:HEAT repeat protein
MWQSAHPGLRKLEYLPSVGAGVVAVASQSAHLDLASGAAACLAGGLLLGNIVFRRLTFHARRIDLEENTKKKMGGLPRKEQLKLCYAILRDERAPRKSRVNAAKIMGSLEAVEYFPRLVDMMDGTANVRGSVAGAVFVAVARMYGRLDSGDKRQNELMEWFDEGKHSGRYTKDGIWGQLLAVHEDKLVRHKSLAIPILENALLTGYSPAAEALGKIGPAAMPALGKALHAEISDVVTEAASEALGRIGHPAAIPVLETVLKQGCIAAAGALGAIGRPAIPVLERVVKDSDRDVSQAAAEALSRIDKFSSEQQRNRVKAYICVGKRDWKGAAALGPAAVPALEDALEHRDSDVSQAAAEALLRIDEFKNESERNRVKAYICVGKRDWKGAAALGPAAVPPLENASRNMPSYAREALVAAVGRIGPAGIPLLANALKDKNAGVRKAAAEALGETGRAGIPLLANALAARERGKVKEAIAEALGKIGPAAVPALKNALEHGDSDVRKAAARALGGTGPAAIPVLGEALKDGDTNVRSASAEALGKVGPAAIPALERVLEHEKWTLRKDTAVARSKIGSAAVSALIEKSREDYEDWMVKGAAAEALGKIGPAAIPALEKALTNEKWYARKEAARALGETGASGAIPALERTLVDGDEQVRMAAAEALGKIGDPAAIPALEEALDLTASAVSALGRIGPAAIPALERALKHRNNGVRICAESALERLGCTVVRRWDP